jgi:hypothetical protein
MGCKIGSVHGEIETLAALDAEIANPERENLSAVLRGGCGDALDQFELLQVVSLAAQRLEQGGEPRLVEHRGSAQNPAVLPTSLADDGVSVIVAEI